MNRVKAFLLAAGLGFLFANCGGGGGPSTPTTPSAPTVTSVTVTGPAGNPGTGQSAQFTATANFSNATTQNITTQASWQSSNSSIAAVSGSGMVTAVAPGEVEIRATYQSVTGSSRITVVLLRFTLSGVVREEGSNGPIPDARVEITDGQNAGRNVTTPGDGSYSITELLAENLTVRTSRSGYETNSRVIQLQQDTRQDIALKRASSPTPPPPPAPGPTPAPGPNGPTCAASSIPSNAVCIGTGTPPVTAVCNDGAYSCSSNRSGTCSTHGGVKCWVCPGALCNGLTAPISWSSAVPISSVR